MAISYNKHSWAYGEELTPDKFNNMENGIAANASAINEVNNNLASTAYPYGTYSNVTIHGYISHKQYDSTGNTRHLVFVPCPQSPTARFGVKTIRTLVIQGIAVLRQNATDQSGYTLVNVEQDHQGITLSIDTASDISGYICECTFDFYALK